MEDFGIVPVSGSDEATADFALAIDDEGFRPAGDGEFVACRLFRVANGDEIDVSLSDEALV